MRVQTGITAVGAAEFISTGLDIYGRYKEITEAPAYAREAEALRISLAQAEAEAARATAERLKKALLYGGLAAAAIIAFALWPKKPFRFK